MHRLPILSCFKPICHLFSNSVSRSRGLLTSFFVLRSSTCLFISVWYTGWVEEPQQGKNAEISSPSPNRRLLYCTKTFYHIVFFVPVAPRPRGLVWTLPSGSETNLTVLQDRETEQRGGNTTANSTSLYQNSHRTQFNRFYSLETYWGGFCHLYQRIKAHRAHEPTYYQMFMSGQAKSPLIWYVQIWWQRLQLEHGVPQMTSPAGGKPTQHHADKCWQRRHNSLFCNQKEELR